MSYLVIDVDDPRTSKIADVISNKTCKKILGVLSEKDASESDISKELKLPMNTVGYNIKKLVEAGLVEKSGSFFWSVKGKKIPTYKLSNKKILISPKKVSAPKGIVPAILATGVIAAGIKMFSSFSFGGSSSGALGEGVSSGGAAGGVAPYAADAARAAETMAAEKIAAEGSSISYDFAADGVSQIIYPSELHNILYNAPNSWVWFLVGALTALLVLVVWNWNKKEVKNEIANRI